jgi:rubrerythrin
MISGDWPVLTPQSSRKEILEVALAREKNACSFYKILYEKSRIKVAEDPFGMLAREESEHVIWISEMICGITR